MLWARDVMQNGQRNKLIDVFLLFIISLGVVAFDELGYSLLHLSDDGVKVFWCGFGDALHIRNYI